MIPSKRRILPMLLTLALAATPSLYASQTASDADQTFVGKVSQGGLYEVKSSQLAEQRATKPAVKSLAQIEVKDHEGVNKRLKKIADKTGVTIAPELNDEFKARLQTLSSASPADFDSAYIQDMKSIHDKDEKLFAAEATGGSAAYQKFAASTDAIVKRHIAALAASPVQ